MIFLMRMKLSFRVIITFVVLFLILALIPQSNLSKKNLNAQLDNNLDNENDLVIISSESSNYIDIVNDTTLASYSSYGSGSQSNPYIIENLTINTDKDTAISISSTTKFFILRSCIVDAYKQAININNVASGTAAIYNNTCKDIRGGSGIIASDSPNITISDNIIKNSGDGIIIEKCENANVINNHCSFVFSPMRINESENAYIFNNTILYGKIEGLSVSYSDRTIIANNTITHIAGYPYSYSESAGIKLKSSSYISIMYNVVYECVYGIEYYGINESVAFGNIFYSCQRYGIYIEVIFYEWVGMNAEIYNVPSVNNIFHHNYFVGRGAYDSGQNSTWYDVTTNEGNYWSYIGSSGVKSISGGDYYDPYPMIYSFPDTDGDGLDDLEEMFTYYTNPYLNDTDGDGLLDGDEILQFNTNPKNNDTDYDGLSDWDEKYVYNTSPISGDTDGDGLTDGNEIFVYSTNPRDSDSDNDGMLDGYEVFWEFDPLNHTDGSEDPDQDGLSNWRESTEGTHPFNNDTDADFLNDGDEVYLSRTNPLLSDTDMDDVLDGIEYHVYGSDPNNYDTDGDGLSDGKEINVYHTSPTNSDTDGDMMSDKLEIKYGFDPLNASDADADYDEDGLSNIEELFIYGTHPLVWDTDGDEFSDGFEIRKGTDPLLYTDHPMTREEKIDLALKISLPCLAVIGLSLYIMFKKKILLFKNN